MKLETAMKHCFPVIIGKHSGELGVKEALLSYNTSDCEALQVVARCTLSRLCGQLFTAGRMKNSNFVDTNKLKGWGPLKQRPLLNCGVPGVDYINRASYWDYRQKQLVSSGRGVCTKFIRIHMAWPTQ